MLSYLPLPAGQFPFHRARAIIIHKRALAAGLLLAGLSGPALGQAQSDPPEDAIVITAQRLAVSAGDSTSAITSITADQIAARQSVSLLGALETVPGLTIAQNGAYGGQASIRLRGAPGEQTLVLLDGVPLNDPSSPGGGLNGAFFDTSNIARIEVLSGPQSTLWGSDAIGGVIAITTRAPKAGRGARVQLEAAERASLAGQASLDWGAGALRARLSANGLATNGISKADSRDGNPEADPYRVGALSARLDWDLSPQAQLTFSGRTARARSAFDSFGFATGVADGPDVETTQEQALLARLQLGKASAAFQHAFSVGYAGIDRWYDSDGFSYGAQGTRQTLRWQTNWQAARNLDVAFGADREESEVADAGRTDTLGLFALGQYAPNARIDLSAGLRQEEHSRFGSVTTGRLGARMAITGLLSARASWGDGFKAPTLFQLTSSFGTLPPNGALQPEKAQGWDGALVLDVFGQTHIEAGLFALDVENMIDYDFASARYENIAQVKTRGLELSARHQVRPGLDLSGAYTYTDAQNARTGARLLRVPEHAGHVQVDYRARSGWGLNLLVKANGEESDVVRLANPVGRNKAWVRADLAARWPLGDGVEVTARVENLFDARYQDVFGYGTLPRTLTLGVRTVWE